MSSSKIFTPANIGPVTLRNRLVRSAAFEAMCPGGVPSRQLSDYHLSVARGGVGMTTVAYCSVTRDGVSFPSQLWIRDRREFTAPMEALIADVHKAGAKISIQLGHCGNMSHRSTAGCWPISASTGFNIYSPTFVRGMGEADIHRVADAFGSAVSLCRRMGFDCVEIHAGHGYLISQFLSPYTNRRRDLYGGSLDRRMAFLRLCMDRVMAAAGKDTGVIVKTNMDDGFASGMHYPETIEVARYLQSIGVHALVLSGGFVSRAPMYVMRGAMPIGALTHYMTCPWLKYSVKAFGRLMIPTVPYEECYFLKQALDFRRELTMPLIYVGGCSRRESIDKVLDAGFDFVQMGRALLRQPDFANRMRDGIDDSSHCTHSNYCIGRMYSREMACHTTIADLPDCLRQEIARLETGEGEIKN